MELEGSGLVFEVSAVNAGKSPPVGVVLELRAGRVHVHRPLVPPPHRHRRLDGVLHADDGRRRRRSDRPRSAPPHAEDAERRRRARAGREADRAGRRHNADNKEGGTGTRAKGEEGSMGNPNTKATNKRYGVQGPQDNPDPHIARQAALQEAPEFGMIGLLNVGAGGDPNAPTAPWGRDDSLGNDPLSARGNMWGDAIGDSFGAGGLGLSGIGEGGGGRGEGIGLGNIGTLGHGAGTGTGQGFGTGHGRLGGAHQTQAPSAPHGRDAGQRSPPAGSHPAHRSPELRSLPSLLRERSAQQPEPPGSRRGASSSSAATARSRRARTAARTCRIRASSSLRRPRLRTASRSRSPKAASSPSSTRSCSPRATDRTTSAAPERARRTRRVAPRLASLRLSAGIARPATSQREHVNDVNCGMHASTCMMHVVRVVKIGDRDLARVAHRRRGCRRVPNDATEMHSSVLRTVQITIAIDTNDPRCVTDFPSPRSRSCSRNGSCSLAALTHLVRGRGTSTADGERRGALAGPHGRDGER